MEKNGPEDVGGGDVPPTRVATVHYAATLGDEKKVAVGGSETSFINVTLELPDNATVPTEEEKIM